MEIGNLQPMEVDSCWRINNEGNYIPIGVLREDQVLIFVPPGYGYEYDPPYLAVCKSDDDHSVEGIIAWGQGMHVEFVEE
ncbi:MAG: hypothetical protein GY799_25190 [Desulfobulbaceae bacterium]|nr:hypothetical protein [Desulfobulbaceae bacterium]